MTADGKMILLFYDSPIIIARLQSYFEDLPNIGELKSAGSYAGALRRLSQRQPDILLLDIHLPDKSGIELLRYVRDAYPAVTVIMLSNQSSTHYRTLCQVLGAAHFIDKSTEFEELPAILAPYLL
jgi:DNA-binding NarL/FixJ family response regulator